MITTVSVTDLKQNTSKVLKKVAEQEKVVVLQRSNIAAILVDPKYYELLEQALEDWSDIQAIEERKDEERVSFDEVLKKLHNK